MKRRQNEDPLAEKRSRRVVPIQDALRDFLSHRGLDKKPLTGRVFAAWRDAAGQALAGRAVPVRFQRGELLVEVNSSAHFQELSSFTGEDLRCQANRILGCERIQRVIFKRTS